MVVVNLVLPKVAPCPTVVEIACAPQWRGHQATESVDQNASPSSSQQPPESATSGVAPAGVVIASGLNCMEGVL